MNWEAMKDGTLAALAVIGSWIANTLGGWDAALIVLVTFMAIDYVTGLMVALVFHASPKTEGGGLASGECFKGLVRKMMILLFVLLGTGLDNVIGGSYVRTAVILFFIGIVGYKLLTSISYPSFFCHDK